MAIEIEPKPVDNTTYPRRLTVTINIKNKSDLDLLRKELKSCELHNSDIFNEEGDSLDILTEVAKSLEYQL